MALAVADTAAAAAAAAVPVGCPVDLGVVTGPIKAHRAAV